MMAFHSLLSDKIYLASLFSELCATQARNELSVILSVLSAKMAVFVFPMSSQVDRKWESVLSYTCADKKNCSDGHSLSVCDRRVHGVDKAVRHDVCARLGAQKTALNNFFLKAIIYYSIKSDD